MNQIKNKPKPSGRPNGLAIFTLALLTAAAVAGVAWLYIQQPDIVPSDSSFSSAISPAELDAIPDGAGRDAHTLLARALREALGSDTAREKFAGPIRGALDRILKVFGDGEQSGRARFDRAALFLSSLPYETLARFDPEYADELRAAAEFICRRLAREKITEIVARHHNRIGSKQLETLAELQTALDKIRGEIAPIAPILKKEEDRGGIFSDLNDIVKFVSERRSDKFSAETYSPGEQEISDTNPLWSEPNETRGAYVLSLKITGAIGRAEDLPSELTLLSDGNRLVGKFPIPSDRASLNLPISENLTLIVAETGETISLPDDLNGTLAPLGMPGVTATETFPLPDLNRAQVKLEIHQTYKLPRFFFDAVAKAEENPAPAHGKNTPVPAQNPTVP